MVFCQVEGEEESGHIGGRVSAKVDSQSKFNQKEAEKIVSKAQKFYHYRLHLSMKSFRDVYIFVITITGGHSTDTSLWVPCIQQ